MREGNCYIELGISVSRRRRDMEGAQSNERKITNRTIHMCGTRVSTNWIAHADSNGFILRDSKSTSKVWWAWRNWNVMWNGGGGLR